MNLIEPRVTKVIFDFSKTLPNRIFQGGMPKCTPWIVVRTWIAKSAQNPQSETTDK